MVDNAGVTVGPKALTRDSSLVGARFSFIVLDVQV